MYNVNKQLLNQLIKKYIYIITKFFIDFYYCIKDCCKKKNNHIISSPFDKLSSILLWYSIESIESNCVKDDEDVCKFLWKYV